MPPKYVWQMPQILPSEFRYDLQLDFFPSFCVLWQQNFPSFPLVWWAWLDFALNFASKLDVRPGPWPPGVEVPPLVDGWILLGVCIIRHCGALSEREVSAWRYSSVCLIVVGSGWGTCTVDLKNRVLHMSTVDNGEMVSPSRI